MIIEACVCVLLHGEVQKSSPGAVGIIGIYCTPRGRVVKEVFPDSSAEHADIRIGDKILFVNGDRCGKMKGDPGTTVTITIQRGRGTLKEFILKRVDNRYWNRSRTKTILDATENNKKKRFSKKGC